MNAFLRLMAEEHMIFPGETVLCALSGGADSVCLLHLLWETGKRQGFSVAAAHFDHNIRPESGEDAAFCACFCQERGIPFFLGGAKVPAYAQAHGLGLEEAARILRYRFLEETAQTIGAARIATAHNAEDNAETLLLHLLRGTGLRGLGGIAPVRGNLIRPLLTTRRGEIEAYLDAHHLPHVEDRTNTDTVYTRNYLRHEVLPLLTARNPGLIEGLGRSARSFRRDNAYLEQQAATFSARGVETPRGISYPVAELAALPEAISCRVVQQLAEHLSPGTVLSASHREGVLALCAGDRPSAVLPLPDGLNARRVYQNLVLEKTVPQTVEGPTELQLPGSLCWNGWQISATAGVCPEGKFNQPHCFYLQAQGPLVLRSRETGDEITLPARNRKRIKKLLIDAHIPKAERDTLPVFTEKGRVVALAAFGADQAALPQPGQICWKILCQRDERALSLNSF